MRNYDFNVFLLHKKGILKKIKKKKKTYFNPKNHIYFYLNSNVVNYTCPAFIIYFINESLYF